METLRKYIAKVRDLQAWFIETRDANKAELIRGGCLDPFNHPSYTAEQVADAQARHAKAAALRAEADAVIG